MSATERLSEVAEAEAGLVGGGEIIDDTNLHTGTWRKIQAIEASTVIATLAGSISGTAVALAVSGFIVGQFTGITLTSGSVVAYDKI